MIASELGAPTWREENPATEAIQAKKLWDGVVEDTGNPLLLHFLTHLIEVGKVPARDPVALARAVQLYSARCIKFFRERPERFQSAMRTIAWGIGDCDDKSRFIAASLRTFRIPVRLRFIRFTSVYPNGERKRVGHVYPVAYLDGRWIPLESVREYPFGYDPEVKARKNGTGIKIQDIGDSENT